MVKINPKSAEKDLPAGAVPTAPADLKKALAAAPLVGAVWESLTQLARWDFIIWVNQTKNPETRKHRIKVAISKLSAGKRRPCCFTIVPADLYKAMKKNTKAKAKWKNLGPIERREFVTWIGLAKESADTKARAGQACMLIAAGKGHP